MQIPPLLVEIMSLKYRQPGVILAVQFILSSESTVPYMSSSQVINGDLNVMSNGRRKNP